MNSININKQNLTKKKEVIKKYLSNQHPFHLVTPSPWPLFTSIGAFSLTLGSVLYFHNYTKGTFILLLGLFILILSMGF
jgi:hypothetical protein